MKTPKREHHSCWRCGGPLDVHLDPSGETEEYSICRDCHRKTISHCGNTWKPYKERARWIRKNREARLRRKIAYMDAQIMIAEEAIIGLLSYVARLRRGGDEYPSGYATCQEAIAEAVAGLFLKTLKKQKKGGAR